MPSATVLVKDSTTSNVPKLSLRVITKEPEFPSTAPVVVSPRTSGSPTTPLTTPNTSSLSKSPEMTPGDTLPLLVSASFPVKVTRFNTTEGTVSGNPSLLVKPAVSYWVRVVSTAKIAPPSPSPSAAPVPPVVVLFSKATLVSVREPERTKTAPPIPAPPPLELRSPSPAPKPPAPPAPSFPTGVPPMPGTLTPPWPPPPP